MAKIDMRDVIAFLVTIGYIVLCFAGEVNSDLTQAFFIVVGAYIINKATLDRGGN